MNSKLPFITLVPLLLASCARYENKERACTPPPKEWQANPGAAEAIPTVVSLDRNGAIYLNGIGLTLQELSMKLGQIGAVNPQPAVSLETEMGAPCDTLDRVRSVMNNRLQCNRGGPCHEGLGGFSRPAARQQPVTNEAR